MVERERRHHLLGAGIARAAARDDQRPLGGLEQCDGLGHALAVRAGTRDLVHGRREEGFRIVAGHFLDVLRQGDEGRAAIGRIEQAGHGLRQRGDDLLGMHDAVPVARHRLEGVIHVDGGIAIVLDLLHHRIGPAVHEGVAGEDEDRQAVGMGDAGRRHHVHGARADGRGGHHDLAAALGLGEADGGQRHGLLVLAAPGGQHVLHRLERLREAGDVAVPEDREDPRKEGNFLAIHHGELVAQVAHQRLSHRQADGRHCGLSQVR